jgi:hypothetical protein
VGGQTGYVYVVSLGGSAKINMCQPTVLKHVVSYVAEAEYGALFVNAKTGTGTRETLKEMGHPQDATELKTDNTTADGIANKTVLQKKVQCYGHALLLDPRPHRARTIRRQLGPRRHKLG